MFLFALTAMFLAAGIWFLTQRLDMQNRYLNIIAVTEDAAKNPDLSTLEALEADQNSLLAENSEMESRIGALEEELASLDQDIAQLQQEYEQLAQQEDSVYYQTIFQSLTEGMSLVESYISGNE